MTRFVFLVLTPLLSLTMAQLRADTTTGVIVLVDVDGEGPNSAQLEFTLSRPEGNMTFVVSAGATQPFFAGATSVTLDSLLSGTPLTITYSPSSVRTPEATDLRATAPNGRAVVSFAAAKDDAKTMTGTVSSIRASGPGDSQFQFTLRRGWKRATFAIRPTANSEPQVALAMFAFVTTARVRKAPVTVSYVAGKSGPYRATAMKIQGSHTPASK